MKRQASRCWPVARLLMLVPAALLLPLLTRAQQPMPGSLLPNPRIFTVTPYGARVGDTIELTFTGTDLEEPESLFFSHPGIKAEPIIPPLPPPDPKKPVDPKQPPPKQIISKFKVTIPPETPVGVYDVRMINKFGVSNPRAFTVGDLAEVQEKEPNNDVPEAQRVAMNSTINGTVAAATDVDYFVFAGKKGERVILSCLTSSIDSRLTAGLELFDSGNRRLGENRHYSGNDALLDYTIPADGDYFVRLYEFTHLQGGPEYFYRFSITTAPWIDAILPPVVEPGKQAKLTVYGRNLPDGKLDPSAVARGKVLEKITVTVDPPADPRAAQNLTFGGLLSPLMSRLDGFEYRLKNASGSSNPYLLTFARAPVVIDNGANDTPDSAQQVSVPCEITGTIEKRRDRDWYSFSAKKGEVYNIEVFSERLGAPTDVSFVLRNADTKQDIVDLDDDPETLSPIKFFTRSNDPARYRLDVKADSKYQLLVRTLDNEVRASPRHLYRVSITPERPDFRLIVLPPADDRPDACRLLQGGNQYFTVLAWRNDGFNDAITLTAEGLPSGVTCPPQVLGPGLKQALLVVSATPATAPGVFELKVKGTATILGQSVVRDARPASITWPIPPQQNIPTVSRLDRNLFFAVRDQAPFNLAITIDKADLLVGEKANLSLKLTRIWPDFKVPLQVVAVDMPLAGNQPLITVNNNQPLAMAPGKDEATAVVEVKSNAVPGTYNLVLKGTAQIPYNKDPMAKQKPNINVVLPSTPLTLNIFPKQVANVTLGNANLTAKQGTQTEVVVKVARLNSYAGEFKVQLVAPPNIQGFSADEVTIPAGMDEAKLILKIAPAAPVGNRPDLLVRAVALYQGKVSITQEAKLGVNVVK